MKRAVLYLRVSTIDQTTANQESELRQIAGHMGCQIVKVYKDHGISGAKGRNGRPAFDALYKAAARREFDMVMAWSVDRLGRSLQGSRLDYHFQRSRNESVRLAGAACRCAKRGLNLASVPARCSASLSRTSRAQARPQAEALRRW